MHELSVALEIISIASEAADDSGGGTVKVVRLRLGPLAGVDAQALIGAYAIAREGTMLAEAELVVDELPIVARCPHCRRDRVLQSILAICCPECGALDLRVVSGRELEVTTLEIES
jgi:hydrogenase nickel incorporation protein HypA/HybF